MSAMQRNKGKVGERQVATIARAAGFPDAKRTGDSQQAAGDVAGITGTHCQVKWCQRLDLPRWWRELEAACPPDKRRLLAHRRNGEPWLATVPLEDYLRLLAATKHATDQGGEN